MDRPDMWFLTCVPKFSSLACLEVPQEPPRPRSHTWRMLKVPDWRLGRWGHPWYHGSLWYMILDLYAKFQLPSMNRSLSRTPLSSKSYLEDIKLPDCLLGRWVYSWHHGLSWYVILDLCAKFKLSRMNRSVSRTPLSSKLYFEDVDGSWLDIWRIGSFLTL